MRQMIWTYLNRSSGADDLNDSESSNSNHTMIKKAIFGEAGSYQQYIQYTWRKTNQMLLANPMVIQSLESRGLDSMEVS